MRGRREGEEVKRGMQDPKERVGRGSCGERKKEKNSLAVGKFV